MKRDARLRGLSSDHHHALVLARSLTERQRPWTQDDGADLGRRAQQVGPRARQQSWDA
jgi:hypothetical protein